MRVKIYNIGMATVRKQNARTYEQELFEPTCFGWFQRFAQPTKPIPIRGPVLISSQSPLNTFFYFPKVSKPQLISNLLQLKYEADFDTWDDFLKYGDLVGTLGIIDAELFLPSKVITLQIGSGLELNSLQHIQRNRFQLILSTYWDPFFLYKVSYASLPITLRAQSDQELNNIIHTWQRVLKLTVQNENMSYNKLLCKNGVSVRVIGQFYWVTINQCFDSPGDYFKLPRITIGQAYSGLEEKIQKQFKHSTFVQLKQRARECGHQLTNEEIVEFLLQKAVIHTSDMQTEIRQPNPDISEHSTNEPGTTHVKPQQESQIPQKDDRESQDSAFLLHLMDRYEGIDGEDERRIVIVGTEQKTRKRSQSFNSHYSGPLTENSTDYDSSSLNNSFN